MSINEFLHPETRDTPGYVVLSTSTGAYAAIYAPRSVKYYRISSIIGGLSIITGFLIYIGFLWLASVLFFAPVLVIYRRLTRMKEEE